MAAPWVILGRVLRVAAADEEPGDAADAAAFSLAVALPPRVAVLAAARSAHPDPARPDKYPYILAAGPEFLLSRFSAYPFHGARFGPDPPETHLVVARPFVTAAGETTASAERVPDRPAAVRNIEGVGLIGAADGDGYVVAELEVERGSDRARLFRVHSGHGQWLETELLNPLPVRDREWVSGGVVSLGGKLWWFDLSWGILSCDVFVTHPVPVFVSLPPDRVLSMAGGDDIHEHRCITVSGGSLRYVEISDVGGRTQVCMFTLENNVWKLSYQQEFEEIWSDNSYKKTWLPEEIPELVLVCPLNPDLVYFALERHIFCVDIPQHKVIEFGEEQHELVSLSWPTPASSRYVLAWELPARLAEELPPKKEKANLDDEAYPYAMFCSNRAATLKRKKDFELCHICLMEKGIVKPVKKTGMEDHCSKDHGTKGFVCDKTGCFVRARTLGEIGLHRHYCHGQSSRGWWRVYMEEDKHLSSH